MKMYSFPHNIGLLTLVVIVLKKVTLLCEGLETICLELTEMYMTGLNKMCSFFQNIGLLPLIAVVLKINPTLWRSGNNLLKIDWDIDENVQLCSKHRVVTPSCWLSWKINPTLWRFERQSIKNWDIDMMCSFAWNRGLLSLIVIDLKKALLCEDLETICWELT